MPLGEVEIHSAEGVVKGVAFASLADEEIVLPVHAAFRIGGGVITEIVSSDWADAGGRDNIIGKRGASHAVPLAGARGRIKDLVDRAKG